MAGTQKSAVLNRLTSSQPPYSSTRKTDERNIEHSIIYAEMRKQEEIIETKYADQLYTKSNTYESVSQHFHLECAFRHVLGRITWYVMSILGDL